MDARILLFFTALAALLCGPACSRIFVANGFSEDDAPEPESYDSSPGPEKMSIEILQVDDNGQMEEEEATKERLASEVDEETIRKAEKIADEDLLNGLNRILKNNQTLKDVLKAENVYQIS